MTGEASEAAMREARQYWGYLFNKDKTPTDLLERLLSGIHAHIIKSFGNQDECQDATTWQMANFYGSVGGREYASFFLEQEPSQISFIYTSLGCPHSLQPAPDESTFVPPSIPALKRKGYVSWQSIQILLGPEEHVGYLTKAVAKFNIIDPLTGRAFPKLLPADAFPHRPDEEMTAWFEQVGETLKRQEALHEGAEYAAQARMNGGRSPAGSSGENSPTVDKTGRPALFRRITRMASPAVLKKMAQDKSGTLVGNVRHFWSPATTSRSNARDRNDDSEEDDYDNGPTPTSNYPSRYKYSSNQSNRRRADSTASEDTASSSEIVPVRPQRQSEPPRPRRSHEDRSRAGEYFATYEEPRRHSSTPTEDPNLSGSGSGSGFAPSREPLFATRVSQQMKPPTRPSYSTDQRRPSLARSGRYVGDHVRHHSSDRLYPTPPRSAEAYTERNRGERRHSSVHDSSQREWQRSQGRDRDRDRSKERDRSRNRERTSSERDRDWDRYRDKERPRIARYVTPKEGVTGRRYPVEAYR